jgi:hypothetical protein
MELTARGDQQSQIWVVASALLSITAAWSAA